MISFLYSINAKFEQIISKIKKSFLFKSIWKYFKNFDHVILILAFDKDVSWTFQNEIIVQIYLIISSEIRKLFY
jgi:hypothetical protein